MLQLINLNYSYIKQTKTLIVGTTKNCIYTLRSNFFDDLEPGLTDKSPF